MQKKTVDSKNIPGVPGIYTFLDADDNPLYVGKATSLRDRVKSYFSSDLLEARGPAIVQMVEKARDVRWEETDSVLEALILEAHYIKKKQPPYNAREKDDKSFNYLVITNEAFPQVRIVRGRELATRWDEGDIKYTFGPFVSGGQLREALRLVRKIFPFRDAKCVPCEDTSHRGYTRMKRGLSRMDGTRKRNAECKPCFNRQIGLCPGVCTGEVSKTEYARTIQHLRLFFEGRKKKLITQLEREMKQYADEQQFERAAEVRRQLFALRHIQDVSLLKRDALPQEQQSFRVEAYDVAHTSEKERVGVMTVVAGGEAQKGDYRQFKIRRTGGGDTGALTEILRRRLKHDEWQYPQLVVVDGGKAQVNAALSTLAEFGALVPVVGVVKDERHKPRVIIGATKDVREKNERDILLANSEAHRFALTFHRKRRRL